MPTSFKNLSATRGPYLAVILCSLLLMFPSQGRSEQSETSTTGQARNNSNTADSTAQLSQLQSILFAYADKYMTVFAQIALDIQKRYPADTELRLRIHSMKLLVATTVQELAVSPNPESTLLDMMVYATLHRISFEEDWARETFGESVESLISSTRELEKEIWNIGSGYLSEQEIAEIQELIQAWKQKNPDLKWVSFIRFSDFASIRSKSPLVEKARSHGFLVDTSGAEQVADQALLLSERILHYSQRMPYIIEWQVEKVFYQLAVEPEFKQSLEQSRDITRSLNRFVVAVEQLPQQLGDEREASIEQMATAVASERNAAIAQLSAALANERRATLESIRQSVTAERVAIFEELNARQESWMGTVSDARAGVAEADQLTVELEKTTNNINEVLKNADLLLTRFDSDSEAGTQDSEPFDLDSYVLAINQLSNAIREANTLLLSTERLTSQEHAMGAIFDRALWTGTILILILCVAIFVTMLIYRAAARHIVPRSSFEPVGSSNRQ